MSDIDKIKEGIVPKPDKIAEQQTQDFIRQCTRENREKDTKHLAFVIIMWVGTFGVSFVLFAKIYHLVAGHAYAWLDKEQLNSLDSFLTSSVIGGSIVGFFKSKIINEDKKP